MHSVKQPWFPTPGGCRESSPTTPSDDQRHFLSSYPIRKVLLLLSTRGITASQISMPSLILILVNKLRGGYLNVKTLIQSLFFLLKGVNCRKCKSTIPSAWRAQYTARSWKCLSHILLEHRYTFTLRIVRAYFLTQQSERWVAASSFKTILSVKITTNRDLCALFCYPAWQPEMCWRDSA